MVHEHRGPHRAELAEIVHLFGGGQIGWVARTSNEPAPAEEVGAGFFFGSEMKRLTQTRSDNCWQTCVAMLLGCAAEDLPAQHEFNERTQYVKVLRVFLDKHYGLTYVEVETNKPATVPPCTKGHHLLIGPSPRTTTDNDTWHAIIGLDGEPYWDVNPSRAGLTEVRAWGLLVPTPEEWRTTWNGEACLCPSCDQMERAIA